MTFIRMHAIFVSVQTSRRYFWSKPEKRVVKLKGDLTLSLPLCAQITAFAPTEDGVPLEIVKINSPVVHTPAGVPHIRDRDYVELMRAISALGLKDLITSRE